MKIQEMLARNSSLILIFLTAVATVGLAAAQAAEEKSEERPTWKVVGLYELIESKTFPRNDRYMNAPSFGLGSTGAEYMFLGIKKDGAVEYASYLNIQEFRFLEKGVNAERVLSCSQGWQIRYPRLHLGDVFPMIGGVYRVQSFGNKELTVKRLDADALPSDVPSRIELFAVPLGCLAKLYCGRIEPIRITPADEREPFATALVQIGSLVSARSKTYATATVKVRIRDKLYMGGRVFEVRDIVPPDDDRHIVGWVELFPHESDRGPHNVKSSTRVKGVKIGVKPGSGIKV